ncbi:hypothetical protein GGR50DRAFT_687783 [Xylaria sp. CBS 124048]|nr:hypothetical protein GGR50DRAFT_687783 [Xylaria sp. CBS 124048]
MASSTNADTLISIKVSLDGGATRRFRLPLRDLGVTVFENKLRALLMVPGDMAATIERYSDSATSYVTLEGSNLAVYKQLYRAARAKQKLRLRVTTRPANTVNEAQVPKSVTIEDEPEEKSETVTQHDIQQIPEQKSEEHKQEPELVLEPQHEPELEAVPERKTQEAKPEASVNDIEFNFYGFPIGPLQYDDQKLPRPVKIDLRDTSEASISVEKNEAVQAAKSFDLPKPAFTVCCNSCDVPVPDTHYHCSICDEGDFDLCQDCVNRGISCYGDGHWLIRRSIVDGRIECSSTEIIPKPIRPSHVKTASPPAMSSIFSLPTRPLVGSRSLERHAEYSYRTCNACVREFRDEEFVHCTTCEDYDLCKACFTRDQHGHHPKHGFTPVVKGSILDYKVVSRLPPGRNVLHNAICDGCDKYIRGVRHKCLDCPDWDYCADCIKSANLSHSNHRFIVIYDPVPDRSIRIVSRASHFGITCDGPLCAGRAGNAGHYIIGERYKCAVCHDTDFCANCEASPANLHNKTHPLIKFKTPVRHVSVTTTGEHEDGKRLPTMGDKCYHPLRSTAQSPEKPVSPSDNIAATPVQTVVNVQPTEQSSPLPPSTSDCVEMKETAAVKEEIAEVKEEIDGIKEEAVEVKEEAVKVKTEAAEVKKEAAEVKKETEQVKKETTEIKIKTPALPESIALVAIFKWDTIKDGSVLPPNHTFEQTWVLRNEGNVPWPAGCSVKFVGGDYMGAVDPARPAGIRELISASESTICYDALNPGQEFPFTVLMRTPDREGKIISYWRLTTPDGVKFGHKIWCDVTVQAPSKPGQTETNVAHDDEDETDVLEESEPTALTESRMIIPTLEHESPLVSVHESQLEIDLAAEADTIALSGDDEDEGFEDCGGHDDWANDSVDSFLTDDEYDILDASDEEFLFEQQKTLPKK